MSRTIYVVPRNPVGEQVTLHDALKTAKAGDTVCLEPATYRARYFKRRSQSHQRKTDRERAANSQGDRG